MRFIGSKFLYIIGGVFFTGVGIIGVVLPVLPTVPFLLLATAYYAKGSARMYEWFKNTRVYKNHLEEFIETRSMTMGKKLSILLPVSVMLAVVFICTPNMAVRITLLLAFLLKYYYFIFRIKTIPSARKEPWSSNE